MLWSATAADFTELLWTRLFLGAVTASAGPMVASLVGDWFGSWERGRIYGVILAGEYLGAGVGFAVTGNVAALSWRAAFVILALPAFALALVVWRLREPERGGKGVLAHDSKPPPVSEPDETTTADDRRAADRARPRRRAGSRARHQPERGPADGTRARDPLRAAGPHERRPDRGERLRLLLPRRHADVRPRVLPGAVRDRPGARELPPARGRGRLPGRRPRRRRDRRPAAQAGTPERPRPDAGDRGGDHDRAVRAGAPHARSA